MEEKQEMQGKDIDTSSRDYLNYSGNENEFKSISALYDRLTSTRLIQPLTASNH